MKPTIKFQSIKQIKLFFVLTLFAVLSFLTMFSSSWAATYYVDATNGNDSNDGLALSTAWKTIAKVNASNFQPGDFILFKRGEIWREQLTVPSSGTSGHPITFGAYGTGNNPVISGANIASTWTDEGSSIYSATLTTEPEQLFYDDTRLTENGGTTTSVGSNEWDWDSNTLYINVGEDPSGGYVEISQRNFALWMSSKNYLTFQNLSFTKANGDVAVILIDGSDITYDKISVSNGAWHGIAIVGGENITIENSDIYGNESAGIFSWKVAATEGNEVLIKSNTVHDNKTFGIEIVSDYHIIEYNTVYDNGSAGSYSGIEVDNVYDGDDFPNHNIIRYNTVYGQIANGDDGTGIYADEYSDYTDIYYNVVYGNDGPGISTFKADYVNIYNNTVYGNCQNSSGELTHFNEIHNYGNGTANSTNVVIKNNLVQATVANTYNIYFNRETYNMTGLDISNNIWYSTSMNWYYWNDSGGNNLSTWNGFTGVGTDFNEDPLITDPDNADFTLQVTSLAIDSGTDVGLSQDYTGNSIVEAPDIGAYEYQGLAKPTNFRIRTP